MATPNSSPQLRAAVDAVATPSHETAFRVLDLYHVYARRTEWCPRSRLRARELAATLDEILVQLARSAAGDPQCTPDRDPDK